MVAKKKKTVKKAAKKKVAAKTAKSKLGHDPLAWINHDDAEELGLQDSSVQADDELIAIDHEALIQPEETVLESSSVPVTEDSDEGNSWGLFDEDDLDANVNKAETESNPDENVTWGLFDDDEPISEPEKNPDEGISWGLFEDIELDGNAQKLDLPSQFIVATINDVFNQLETIVQAGTDLEINAAEVEAVDASGLQLLYACKNELQKRGHQFVVSNASPRFKEFTKISLLHEQLNMQS